MSGENKSDNSQSEKGSKEESNMVNGKVCSTSQEYFQALEKWIQEAHMWQNITANFPYFIMCNQYMNQVPQINNNVPNQFGFPFPPPGTNVTPHQNRNLPQNQAASPEGIECRIPSLWKRLLAEFLDFLILFFLKLLVGLFAIDFFEIIDLNQFGFDALQKDMKLDYKVALQMTHNIMILELVHRVVVCIFETFWLVGGVAGRIGGSTPGKSIMGLRVVRCETVTSLSENEERVLVQPGSDLGLGWAFARSFIKNLVHAFFIPASFAFIFFRFNRATYDMICNTIVVEEPVTPYRSRRN